MPAKPIPRFLRRFPLGLALLPMLASAQIAYRWATPISAGQAVLPSQGPASARINPAALAEVRLAAAEYGHYGSIGGEREYDFVQLAAGIPTSLQWPVSVAAGFGYVSQGDNLEGSNAVAATSEYVPGVALRFPADPESRWNLAGGLAFDIGRFDAFGVTRSTSLGIDAGLLATILGRPGSFGFSYAYHRLKSPSVRLPDQNGEYKIPGWMEPAFAWSSPGRLLRFRLGMYLLEAPDKDEAPNGEMELGFSGWEAEVRPVTWFALKAETTLFNSMSNLGVVFYPPEELTRCRARAELNLGHATRGATAIPSPLREMLLVSEERDRGLGFLLGLSLSAEI